MAVGQYRKPTHQFIGDGYACCRSRHPGLRVLGPARRVRFRLLRWGTVATPQAALRADVVRPVDITTQLTMWVDDASVPRMQMNAPAVGLLLAYQERVHPYYGDVVFTGSTDAEGAPHGLTEDQALALLDRYLQRRAQLPRARRH
ncbi:DUF3846 domain-containing protein [Streptomyces sp. NPDC056663]|uniref:DUF3846 domain-containing protein n=1 Tax=Streptomyces sp. NPDC056663 TaxID=3345899 RepID=UPI0036A1A7DE